MRYYNTSNIKVVKKKKIGNMVVLYGVDRINKNKNFIMVINGETGSGKTYAGLWLALEFARELGTSFNVRDNMDFNFANLLRKTKLPQNMKPGTVFLFEEVGAFDSGSAAREWQSKANRFFNTFMQTSRHRNQILILTCPLFTNLEAGTRKLVHFKIQMTGINKQNKVSYGKPKRLQVNDESGKIYKKYLRFVDETTGMESKYNECLFKLPPKDVLDEYERLKLKYTSAVEDKIIEGDKEKEKVVSGYEKYKEEVKTLLLEGKKQVDIAVMLKKHHSTIYGWIRRIKYENPALFP